MKKIEILCFSGGGAKAIATIGVLKHIEELIKDTKIITDIKEVCGVSAGTIIGLAYVLGYKYLELQEEILEKNFESLKDIKITNFLSKYGLDSGKNIITWLDTIILKKGFDKNITFKELHKKTNITFKVLATNLNKYQYTCFDHINTPDMLVTNAIHMSISIPFYFCAQKYENDYHVDGALIDNYPIKLYKENLDNVLGVKIVNYGEMSHHKVEYKINTIDSFIFNVLYCFIIQKEKETTLNEKYKKHTIYIYANEKNAINFSLSKDEKLKLINIGYIASQSYFNS
jgi:predicted acylesterase/phospholipase RssA